MTLNMGPQHPSTHGVLRVVLKLDGELITDCDPVIGYLHRGTEKLGEHHRYAQVIPWTDRTDYVAAPMNNLGCVLAFEKLCGVEAPERAQYWRVIMSELARIASHLVWLGTHALDIGALSMSLYCFRERELILDLFEAFCGARLTTNMMEIGGFSRPIPENLPGMVRDFLKIFPERQQEYADLLSANPIWMARTKGVGRHPGRRGHQLLADRRLSAWLWRELRHPQGDALLRLRPARFRGAARTARRHLRPLPRPHGRDAADDQDHRPGARPVRADGHAADGLRVGVRHSPAQGDDDDRRRHAAPLHLGHQGIQPARRRGLRRGRASEGGARLLRRLRRLAAAVPLPHPRPDFVNLGVLPYMANGSMLADVVALIGTIDIVLGSVDR